MSILLDTHIWIRWLLDAEPLTRKERGALDGLAATGGVKIAVISLWEAQMLQAKGRLQLDRPFKLWLREAAHPDTVQVLPMNVDVMISLDEMPGNFHGDPADRLIVATARAHGLALATHDAAIRKSRAVKIWKP